MDGPQGEMMTYFKCLLIRGFYEVRRHLDDLLILIKVFLKGKSIITINLSCRLLAPLYKAALDCVERDI